MEGDGQIRGGGEKLEGAAPTNVATQDPSRNLVAVGDGQHVAVTDVQSGQEEDRQGQEWPVASVQDDWVRFAVTSADDCVGDEMTSKAKRCIHPQARR